jgi:hypothetical protein
MNFNPESGPILILHSGPSGCAAKACNKVAVGLMGFEDTEILLDS